MAGRVYIRQGTASSASGTDSDFTDFAPPFDQNGKDPKWQMGMRYGLGEASQGQVRLIDSTGTRFISGGQYEVRTPQLITAIENAAGCDYWYHRGRVQSITAGRGAVPSANNAEWDVVSMDGNIELRGQAFTEEWARPAETGYARLVALQAYTLNGASSTAAHSRPDCEVTVLDSHLAKNANSVVLPAKTYPIGTQPQTVVDDCATTEGKDYAVVIHHAPLTSPTTMSWSSIPTTAASAPHWPFCGSVQKIVGVNSVSGGTAAIVSTYGATGEGPGGAVIPSGVTVASGTANRAMVVFTASMDSTQFSSVTYRPNATVGNVGTDQAFTQIGSPISIASTADDSPQTKGICIQAWVLVAPAASSGATNGSIFTEGDDGSDVWSIGAYYLSGVDQSSPVADSTDVTSSGTTSISGSAAGSLILDGIAYRTLWSSASTATAGASQTNDITEGNGVESFGIMNTVLQTSHKAGSANDSCSHLCLQYIKPEDLTTNPCSIKISDDISEVDEDAASPTVYAPRWLAGKATQADGSDLWSAIVSRYGAATSAAVFVEDTSRSGANGYWAESYDDGESVNATQAATRASNILSTKTNAHYTHRVSIRIKAEELYKVLAGMAIQIKAAAAMSGTYLGTYQTRRIAECIVVPVSDDYYRCDLQLDRPTKKAPVRTYTPASTATTPKSATEMPYDPTASGSSYTTVQQVLDGILAGTVGPLTTLGDMLYRGTGGSNTRLAIGASNTHLTSDGTKPVWSPQSALTNPMTTAGDIITGGAAGAATRLGIGASNTRLASTGSAVAWRSSLLTDDGDVGISSPSNNQVLTYDSATGKWKNANSASGFSDPTTTKGDLIVHGASTTREPVGTDGQVLTADSTQTTGIKWATPSSSGISVGTANPGSPTSGDRFFRTDLNFLITYDGTRWLTVNEYTLSGMPEAAIPLGASSSNRAVVDTTYQLYLMRLVCMTFAGGLSGSAYWTVTAKWAIAAGTETSLGSFNNSADTSSNWTTHIVSVNAALSTTARELKVELTKTGAPGSLYYSSQWVYRFIIT